MLWNAYILGTDFARGYGSLWISCLSSSSQWSRDWGFRITLSLTKEAEVEMRRICLGHIGKEGLEQGHDCNLRLDVLLINVYLVIFLKYLALTHSRSPVNICGITKC